MLKGLGDIGNMMKMQRDMKSIQKKLKKTSMQGESNDGSVSADVNGEYQLMGINIEPGLIAEGDGKKIEKQVVSAVNNAVEKIKEYSASEMAKLTGGMDLSSLMK